MGSANSVTLENGVFEVVTLGGAKSDGSPDLSDVKFRLPVPHRQMKIKQAVQIDTGKVKGRSGSIKQAAGYEDAEITISLLLVDDEDKNGTVVLSALDQLAAIQAAFRSRSEAVRDAASGRAKVSRDAPSVFSIQSRLTDACGIRTVLFRDLSVSDFEGVTDFQVDLVFVEFEPTARRGEGRGKQKPGATAESAIPLDDYLAGQSVDPAAADAIAADAAQQTSFDADTAFTTSQQDAYNRARKSSAMGRSR